MNFSTWRWGFYFGCPLFSCGAEIAPRRERWIGDFVRYRRTGLILAWKLR